ncbi:protein kinase [Sulfolobus sp. A20]|uniref:protein kinase domain-containing protein n=1 Tax=Sulfolobaceae TaxID=118883 RepID=UPI0008460AED|nr:MULTISPECIES: protein kinase [unclassified Sulfolobus]TRM75484.1 protein kinase [Sulfolobus sp. A20-N-F8]TRM77400.1 protein kinase [Sulfolobus sp. B5]TRM80049.1 protein kinase [Sulfolobus sp. D5]TRM86350.1 protein kinase [Sulfolobus sp. C3]TRM92832.1 protein kinase [Sulfolobus sp. A20-N-G8]TRN01133.1 protein kinase [Sulfolobus sp. E1]TRN04685.1 protein kinase [Sulfolobus sp. F1]
MANKTIAKIGIIISIVIPLVGYLIYGIALGSLISIAYSFLAGLFFSFALYSPLFFNSIFAYLFSIISLLLGSVFLYKAYRDSRKKYSIIPFSLSLVLLILYIYNEFIVKPEVISNEILVSLIILSYEISNALQLLAWQGVRVNVSNYNQPRRRDNKFNNRSVIFRAYGLPRGVRWVVTINNVNKYYTDSQILKVNLDKRSSSFNTFRVDTLQIGNDKYIPNPSDGIIREPVIDIYFTKLTHLPSVSNWDPKIWIGRNIGEYKVEEIIGIGGSSYVLKVRKGDKFLAMKIPKIEGSKSGQTRINAGNIVLELGKEFISLQEISLKSNNIVQLYGISEISIDNIMRIEKGDSYLYLTKPPFIVMELMEGGSSYELMSSVTYRSSEWYKVVAVIMREVAMALDIIHSAGYVHLDVKPQNIYFDKPVGRDEREIFHNLYTGRVAVKLGDLGSARRIGEKFDQFTEFYCPYEQIVSAILKTDGAKPSMDIFALGSSMYKLLTGSYVFPDNYYSLIEKAIDDYTRGGRNYIIYLSQAKNYIVLPKIVNVPIWFSNLLYRTLNQNITARQIYEVINNNLR